MVRVLLEEFDFHKELRLASVLVELFDVEAAFLAVSLETKLTIMHLDIKFVELFPNLLGRNIDIVVIHIVEAEELKVLTWLVLVERRTNKVIHVTATRVSLVLTG